MDFYIFSYLLELMIDYDKKKIIGLFEKIGNLINSKTLIFIKLKKKPSFDEILPQFFF